MSEGTSGGTASKGTMRAAASRFAPRRPQRRYGFERLDLRGVRIDEPEVPHAHLQVDVRFAATVERRGRRREHLAHPVRCEVEVGAVLDDRHALAAPPRDVRHQDVWLRTEVKLGFVEEDPSTGAPVAFVEAPTEACPEARERTRVASRRPGVQVKVAVDHLGDHVRGRAEHVFVRGELARGGGHGREDSSGSDAGPRSPSP